jgi:Sulfatase
VLKLMSRLLASIVVAAAAVWGFVTLTHDGRSAHAAAPIIPPNAPRTRIPAKPPVVMIVMDEFPVDALLGPDGDIDPVRFPNFAALAATGTWFRNASTVYDSTTRAIPAVFDGKLPRRRFNADYRTHPRTVYDLFGPRGYRIVRNEEATSLCPPRYCRRARAPRPRILPLLAGGRRERLDRFIKAISPGRPTFYLKHVLLPHAPYLFLPSGKQTRLGHGDPIPGMNRQPGFYESFLVDHNHQRFLLQLGYTDRQLGRLFDRMVANGTFDQALIVITADHGYSFDVGLKDHRTATPANIDEIAPVPLFVKAPGQRVGRTSRAYARTIDVVPTIADVLNVRMPYRADGRSAFSRAIARRRVVRMIKRDFSGTMTVPAARMEARRRALVRRWTTRFGSGSFATIYPGIGPNRALLGRSVASLAPTGPGAVRAAITSARDLRAVNPRSLVLPTQIGGPVRGGRRGQRRDIAVAVNGRIVAVGRTFYLRGSSQEGFAVNVPETALRRGANPTQVFQVTGRGTRLQLIGQT